MKYDVTTFNFLYGFFTESDQSQMVDEVKALMFEEQADLSFKPILNAKGLVIIDFIPFARSSLSQDKKDRGQNFGAFIEEIFYKITSIRSAKLHTIFDIYIQGSIKGLEHLHRNEGGALHLTPVREEAPMP